MAEPHALDQIGLRRIDGGSATLADYAGQVVLVVNVASKCGLTPQYESLERAYTAHRADGLVVLGFPCNQFRGQEPGSEAEIQAFCSSTYDVDFPLFAKIDVNGSQRHPLYQAMIDAEPDAYERPEGGMRERLRQFGVEAPRGDVMWNFEKFLIGRDGRVIGRYAPDITIDDAPLRDALHAELVGAA